MDREVESDVLVVDDHLLLHNYHHSVATEVQAVDVEVGQMGW